MLKYFALPVTVSLLALATLGVMTANLTLVYTAITLALIEISNSFDNAVVNAAKLPSMSPAWQKFFMTGGLIVAVGLVRFLLPIEIVNVVSGTGFLNSLNMAMHDPGQFTNTLKASHTAIMGFGSAFLMLTALTFFVDQEKTTHWLVPIERELGGWDFMPYMPLILTFLVQGYAGVLEKDITYLISAGGGIAVFFAIDGLKNLLESFDQKYAGKIISGSLGTAIYLEVLDASFSLDGVIAAFAVSSQIQVVSVGLGIGAMFVRGMTLMLVNTGKMAEYRYLENGAFWSILSLSGTMIASTVMDIPDWLVASVSIGFIVSAAIWSKWEESREALQVTRTAA